jgi:hypothetical protein
MTYLFTSKPTTRNNFTRTLFDTSVLLEMPVEMLAHAGLTTLVLAKTQTALQTL